MNQNHVPLPFHPIKRTKLAHVNLIVWQNFWWKITHICICGSNRHNQLHINFILHA